MDYLAKAYQLLQQQVQKGNLMEGKDWMNQKSALGENAGGYPTKSYPSVI